MDKTTEVGAKIIHTLKRDAKEEREGYAQYVQMQKNFTDLQTKAVDTTDFAPELAPLITHHLVS